MAAHREPPPARYTRGRRGLFSLLIFAPPLLSGPPPATTDGFAGGFLFSRPAPRPDPGPRRGGLSPSLTGVGSIRRRGGGRRPRRRRGGAGGSGARRSIARRSAAPPARTPTAAAGRAAGPGTTPAARGRAGR